MMRSWFRLKDVDVCFCSVTVFSVCRERRRFCTTTAGQSCTLTSAAAPHTTNTAVTLCPAGADAVFVCLFVCRTKIEEINQKKEEELKAMNIRIQKLQTDLMAANQVTPQYLTDKTRKHPVL